MALRTPLVLIDGWIIRALSPGDTVEGASAVPAAGAIGSLCVAGRTTGAWASSAFVYGGTYSGLLGYGDPNINGWAAMPAGTWMALATGTIWIFDGNCNVASIFQRIA